MKSKSDKPEKGINMEKENHSNERRFSFIQKKKGGRLNKGENYQSRTTAELWNPNNKKKQPFHGCACTLRIINSRLHGKNDDGWGRLHPCGWNTIPEIQPGSGSTSFMDAISISYGALCSDAAIL